jgi:hypothetical protein
MARVQQIAKCRCTQYAIHSALQGTPERADGTVGRMRTIGQRAGVPSTEIVFVHAASENSERVANANSLRRHRERITAGLATHSLYKSALPQNTHQLGHIRCRDAFVTADVGNGRAPTCTLMRNMQEAAQSIFFVRAQLHDRNFESGTVSRPKSKPSASLAASDILSRSQGGSKTRSIVAAVTPSTARTFCFT